MSDIYVEFAALQRAGRLFVEVSGRSWCYFRKRLTLDGRRMRRRRIF